MALEKWAQKQGVPVASLTRASDGKQECFYHESTAAGADLGDVIQPVIDAGARRVADTEG